MISAYNSIQFWDQYYRDLIEDASFEDPDTTAFLEAKLTQLQTFKQQRLTIGQQVPMDEQRLATTVGYLGQARYEWMQSFTSLRPLLQREIEPLMPGYAMPASILAQARAEAIAAKEAAAAGTGSIALPLAAARSTTAAPGMHEEKMELFLTDDRVHVGPEVKVLQVGCGTSNMGEEMFNAGWPNVLNIDFSQVGIDLCEEQWKKIHWEEVQAKITKDLADETAKEREMIELWGKRKQDSENGKATFIASETQRVENKNIKRKEQLSEFEKKSSIKIKEAAMEQTTITDEYTAWKSAQPNQGESAPSVLTPETQTKKNEVDQHHQTIQNSIDKWTTKLESVRNKATASLAQSLVDLKTTLAAHAANEIERLDQIEKDEKQQFIQWQQDRRDYDTKGGGLLKGLRYAVCDTTHDEMCTEMLPNETFDLIVDKGGLVFLQFFFLSPKFFYPLRLVLFLTLVFVSRVWFL